MPKGFIYVLTTVGRDYQQPNLQAVPTWFEGRIYFGPCKIPMRPKMSPGDYVFGISPSGTFPRRMLYAARVAERLTFAQAYKRFPKLRGPDGPIHVRPSRGSLVGFPESEYEHIPNANHPDSWRADLATRDLDAFFVFERARECEGRWLGKAGPPVRKEILEFLRSCSVFGSVGKLHEQNAGATETAPVRFGRLYRGLHLETDRPKALLRLVCQAVEAGGIVDTDSVRGSPSRSRARRC